MIAHISLSAVNAIALSVSLGVSLRLELTITTVSSSRPFLHFFLALRCIVPLTEYGHCAHLQSSNLLNGCIMMTVISCCAIYPGLIPAHGTLALTPAQVLPNKHPTNYVTT